MKTRPFGQTGRDVSEIGFDAWAIGGSWGDVSTADAKQTVHAALDAGMTFIDTADVYGDGRSERIIAEVLSERDGPRPFVATKSGRRLSPHVAEGFTKENLTAFVDRSRENLRMECLDLVQLHCPPSEVFYRPEVFDVLEGLVQDGKIQGYGVSVEKVEEVLKAIEYPSVISGRPSTTYSGNALRVCFSVKPRRAILTGKMTASTRFAADDHRAFNRNGEEFDKGETFAGVPYELVLEAIEEIRELVPEGVSMAQFALCWILMEEAVTVVISGARSDIQTRANAAASALPPVSDKAMVSLRNLHQTRIAPHVHHYW